MIYLEFELMEKMEYLKVNFKIGHGGWSGPLRESLHEGSQPVDWLGHQTQIRLFVYCPLGPQIFKNLDQKSTTRMDWDGSL